MPNKGEKKGVRNQSLRRDTGSQEARGVDKTWSTARSGLGSRQTQREPIPRHNSYFRENPSRNKSELLEMKPIKGGGGTQRKGGTKKRWQWTDVDSEWRGRNANQNSKTILRQLWENYSGKGGVKYKCDHSKEFGLEKGRAKAERRKSSVRNT